ncbi:MAG: winged helix DNA-binding domain-containing protein [Nocardioidaceae bacterium]
MRTFDVAERRARLSRRHHLSPADRAADVLQASDGVVGLHATDPASVYLSAWARVDGLSVADVDKALYADRSLVKHLCMRRTLFVFRSELLGVVQAAASERVAAQERRRLVKEVERAGLYEDGTAWLAEASRATLDALDTRGEATSTELRQAVELLQGSTVYAPDKAYGGAAPVGPRVLTTLSAGGHVLRASNNGGWTLSRPTWATTSHWLGATPEQPAEGVARAELVRRWLYAFGPATEADLKWWLGSTLTAVRAALADVGAVEVDLHGRPGVALPDDLDPVDPVAPYAVLLPALDPTTMGWFEREWYLGPHRAQLFDTNGNGGMTAWWDGRIVGGWRQTDDGEVRLQLLADVGAEATGRLEAEAARLSEWLAGVRIAPRFPSPLSKTRT